jgi:protein-L-isoaspartate(D-aspartate) O-methyltransferase
VAVHPGVDELVSGLVAAGAIKSPAVEAAFRAVPRHVFVPEVSAEHAYRNEAIPTKLVDGHAVSSASQPSIVAVMLEQLDVQPGQRVLEIGAGTGYNAALLARLVGPSGHVVTVDLDEDIVEDARAHLAAAGVDGVDVVCGDGGLGHPAGAPYDRIVLTVGAWDLAPAWWDQLAAGGRLLAPLSLRGVQRCVALEEHGPWMESVSVCDCGFMRLRGEFGGPETVISTGGVTMTFDAEVDVTGIPELVARPAVARDLNLSATPEEVFGGLALWLALHDPGYCTVDTVWQMGDDPPIPTAATFASNEEMVGWSPASLDRESLAVLAQMNDRLAVHAFGGESSADRLADAVKRWDARGRPSSRSLSVRVHLGTHPVGHAARLVEIRKRWTTVLIDWPSS